VSFIQIIEHSTSRPDEVRALSEEMRALRGDDSAATRMTVGADRDNPGRYFVIVEFESYEAAMANSNDPRTQEFAGRFAELLDGPPVFHNLDVVEQQTY
jgi:quinol monooxygenase YgiN